MAIGSVEKTEIVDLDLGAEDNSTGYTGDAPLWKSEIKPGQKVIVSGTSTAGTAAWNGALGYLYPVGTETGLLNFRPDNWINGEPDLQDKHNAFKFNIAKVWLGTTPAADDWVAKMNTIKADCTVTMTWDWSNTNEIVVHYTYVHATEGTFNQKYVVTSMGQFESSYAIAIGVDGAYFHVTNITVVS